MFSAASLDAAVEWVTNLLTITVPLPSPLFVVSFLFFCIWRRDELAALREHQAESASEQEGELSSARKKAADLEHKLATLQQQTEGQEQELAASRQQAEEHAVRVKALEEKVERRRFAVGGGLSGVVDGVLVLPVDPLSSPFRRRCCFFFAVSPAQKKGQRNLFLCPAYRERQATYVFMTGR